MAAVLEAKNVTKIFGGGFLTREEENVAVNNISMSLDQKNPKIIAVAGESGSGKTCLLYTSPSPRDKRQSRMPSSA